MKKVFCGECFYYEGEPPKNQRFNDDNVSHDRCNYSENQEEFTNYFGSGIRPINPPGIINEDNDCSWFFLRENYVSEE